MNLQSKCDFESIVGNCISCIILFRLSTVKPTLTLISCGVYHSSFFSHECFMSFCSHLALLSLLRGADVFCSVFQGYYDNPKVCALYVMKGTLEGKCLETANIKLSSCAQPHVNTIDVLLVVAVLWLLKYHSLLVTFKFTSCLLYDVLHVRCTETSASPRPGEARGWGGRRGR